MRHEAEWQRKLPKVVMTGRFKITIYTDVGAVAVRIEADSQELADKFADRISNGDPYTVEEYL